MKKLRLAWTLKVSLEHEHKKQTKYNTLKAAYALGKSFRLNQNMYIYTTLGSVIQTKHRENNHIGLQQTLGFIAQPHKKWKIASTLDTLLYSNKKSISTFEVENRLGDSKSNDYRLSIKINETTQIQIAKSIYF